MNLKGDQKQWEVHFLGEENCCPAQQNENKWNKIDIFLYMNKTITSDSVYLVS